VRTSGPGSRNGYREVTVKATAGPVQLSRPKLRDTTEAFASRLFGSHVTKTNALGSLVIASFVRSPPPATANPPAT
jgi:putative transposase